MTNGKEKEVEKKIEERKPRQFKSKSILESYMDYREFIPINTVEEYIAKKKCVEIGKELLPTNLSDKTEQERITTIYDDACTALNKKDDNREIKFGYADHGGERYPVYNMKIGDRLIVQSEREKVDVLKEEFTDQYYRNFIAELQEHDNKIFHELVKHDVILKTTTEQIMKKMLVKKFENRLKKVVKDAE